LIQVNAGERGFGTLTNSLKFHFKTLESGMSPSNSPANTTTKQGVSSHRIGRVLIVPSTAILVPQLFDYRDPMLIGLPFFYWYLLLWIPLTASLTWGTSALSSRRSPFCSWSLSFRVYGRSW
jgi:hypothetical protein